jgi:hypothetical protein
MPKLRESKIILATGIKANLVLIESSTKVMLISPQNFRPLIAPAWGA